MLKNIIRDKILAMESRWKKDSEPLEKDINKILDSGDDKDLFLTVTFLYYLDNDGYEILTSYVNYLTSKFFIRNEGLERIKKLCTLLYPEIYKNVYEKLTDVPFDQQLLLTDLLCIKLCYSLYEKKADCSAEFLSIMNHAKDINTRYECSLMLYILGCVDEYENIKQFLIKNFIYNTNITRLACYEKLKTFASKHGFRSIYRYAIIPVHPDSDFVSFLFSEYIKTLGADNARLIVLASKIVFDNDIYGEYTNLCIEKLLDCSYKVIIDQNTKADIFDTLSKVLGKEYADKIIDLGKNNKEPDNIFENSQNVHIISDESAIRAFFEKNKKYLPKDVQVFNDIYSDIVKFYGKEKLQRFDHDIGIIFDNMTLKDMLIIVWNIITQCFDGEKSKDLKVHLGYQFEEMLDTCTSGHYLRLPTIFVGTEFEVLQSIKAELFMRINTLLKKRLEKLDNGEDIINNIDNKKYYCYIQKELDDIYEQLKPDYEHRQEEFLMYFSEYAQKFE